MCCIEVDVSIVEPPENTLPVRHGSSFSLKCVARLRRPLVQTAEPAASGLGWLHDGQPLADGTHDGLCGRVVITDVVDINTGQTF